MDKPNFYQYNDHIPLSHWKRKTVAQVVIETESSSTAPSVHASGHESSHHDSAANISDQAQHKEFALHEEHEPDFVMENFDKGSDCEVQPKDDAQEGASRDEDEDDVVENLKDDISEDVSRDRMNVDDEVVDPKDNAQVEASRDSDKEEHDGDDPKIDTSVKVSRDIVDGQGLELVVYGGDPTARAQTEDFDIHEHIEQAIKCILNGMEEHNRGITEFSKHLESKNFRDNQKENLMFLRLDEIKTHLRNLSITINKSLLSISDIVSSKMKSLSTENRTRFTIIEKLKNVEATVNEIDKSQATLTNFLLNFIEDSKKGEDSGKEQQKGKSIASVSGGYKEESRFQEPHFALAKTEMAEFEKLYQKGHYKKLSRSDAIYQFCDSRKTGGALKKSMSKKKNSRSPLTMTESTIEFEKLFRGVGFGGSSKDDAWRWWKMINNNIFHEEKWR
ncbi:hypothetical protein Dimus_033248 [Dionaea muscipula]